MRKQLQQDQAEFTERMFSSMTIEQQLRSALVDASDALDSDCDIRLRLVMAGMLGRLRAMRTTLDPEGNKI